MQPELITYCLVCGEPGDYCGGHGAIGDPDGWRILMHHLQDNHEGCDPHGCEYGDECAEGPCAHPSHG